MTVTEHLRCMRRRTVLAAAAAIGTAGCTGRAAQGVLAERETPTEPLKILDKELTVVGKGTDETSLRIIGRVKNLTEMVLPRAQVRVIFFDADYEKIGETSTFTSDLEPRGIWDFELTYGPGNGVDDVQEYELLTGAEASTE